MSTRGAIECPGSFAVPPEVVPTEVVPTEVVRTEVVPTEVVPTDSGIWTPNVSKRELNESGWNWPATGYESYWMSRFWLPLDKEGFELLERDISARSHQFGRKVWERKTSAFLDTLRNSRLSETWALTTDMKRPNYVPVLAKRGSRNKPVNRVVSKFETYKILYRSISVDAWKRLRTINARSFETCALAYVELGSIISSYFRHPYGLVDPEIKTVIEKMMPSIKSGSLAKRRRLWIVGCLLQHAQASIPRLTEFCTKDLEYSPCWPQEGLGLHCLLVSGHKAASKNYSSIRSCLLKDILSKLPVLSAQEFAELTPRKLRDCMKNSALGMAVQKPLGQGNSDQTGGSSEDDLPGNALTNEGPFKSQPDVYGEPHVDEGGWDWTSIPEQEYESYWMSRFWVPLDDKGFDLLKGRISASAGLRSVQWRATGVAFLKSLLSSGLAQPWSLVEQLVRPNYIPVIAKRRRAAHLARNDFEAYQWLHRSMSQKAWMKLRTVGPKSFERCSLAYVELASIISAYYQSPYGLVDLEIQAIINSVFACSKAIHRQRRRSLWTVGCLLQHAKASIRPLIEFCVYQLGYNPGWSKEKPLFQFTRPFPRLWASKKSPAIRLRLLAKLLMGLPVISAQRFATLTGEELNDCISHPAWLASVPPLDQEGCPPASVECLATEGVATEGVATEGVATEQDVGRVPGTGPIPLLVLVEYLRRGVANRTAMTQKRKNQQEHSPVAKKKVGLNGAEILVPEAWLQPMVDIPSMSHSGPCNDLMEIRQQSRNIPAIRQLQELVNNYPESGVNSGLLDAFAEITWKEYESVLSPLLDYLIKELNGASTTS
ncbi:hypothetical protein GNI_179060 [Gregarina niphandrodes]|uniref:Uncharacterized protein n=1 Tax=Gregarina niphandrodes TaxID=110365 RepID=A0A023AXR8_GRENI|nr:hypothetical protein GNI_179060 [Gregarina niphandrodes]EZG43268.1 hypothetical protein GNI_179060 [Gregarina niphandrodes]|eukprot:XP_011133475.1 hypothetical protein GNI_179060 [Gregarina niphandrodes]